MPACFPRLGACGLWEGAGGVAAATNPVQPPRAPPWLWALEDPLHTLGLPFVAKRP